jgi:ABC-type nitrate/sulfonate/bicarbonate transport system substrate-binding protein
MRHSLLSLVTAVSAVGLLAACSGSSGSAPAAGSASGGSSAAAGPVTVRFVYDWISPDMELIPVAAAIGNGCYKDAGISTEVSFPPDNSTTVKILGTGKADIGLTTTTDVMFAQQQKVPIKAVANYSQSNNWGLIGRPGEPVDITRLKGKSVGVYTDSWTKAMMPFLLETANLKPTDVKQIVAQSDDMALLLAKKIDLATNTMNYGIPSVTEATKQQPTQLLAKDAGAPDVPIWDYSVNTDWLERNGPVVQRWLAATLKGTQWAEAHPEEAVTMFEKAYPKNGYTHAYNVEAWNLTIPFLKTASGQYFTQTDQQWTELGNAMKSVGDLPSVAAPSAYYTNEYLPTP